VFDFRECLSLDQIIQLYRILQEVINNAIKHSEATKIDIQVFGYKKEMSVSIEDNGKGFDIAKPTSGLGLNQLKIRAEILKGKIEINSHPDKGSLILVQVPLE
jgi:signal transduction histidine kinase